MTFDCRQTHQSVSGWLDGELDAEAARELESHLAECSACRQEVDSARREHEQLITAFAPRRAAARQAAESVVDRIATESAPPTKQTPEKSPSSESITASRLPTIRRGLQLLLAAAAGFLVAVLVFRPWEQPAIEDQQAETNQSAPGDGSSPDGDFFIHPAVAEATDVARLSLTTGPVEYAPAAGADFFACPSNAAFESGAVLRTLPSVRCEVDLDESVRLRLNETTETRLIGPRQLELVRGRLWLDASNSAEPYTIATADVKITADHATLDCQAEPPQVTLLVLAGNVSVEGDDWREVVAQGEQLAIDGDARTKQRPAVDPIVETRWVHDLLIHKGANDEELNQRIDRLWAQVGRAKMTHLYEAEIRSLGGHCVTPLSCYIQSPDSRQEHDRRVSAARLLADVAQVESIPELIKLLSDEDGEVRYYAALALERLTGQNFGRQAKDWQASSWTACQPTADQWRTWWQTAKGRYPGVKGDPTPQPPMQKKS